MKKLVLFDFDGVIADSFPLCVTVMKEICTVITVEEQRASFDGNVHDSFSKYMQQVHGPECHHDKDWFDAYLPHFDTVQPFPGIIDVLHQLSHTYLLIVVSSTVTSPIQGFLEKHHVGRYFSDVLGADVHEYKDEKIKMIFERYNAAPEDCVFITDTLGDMKEARKVGDGSIATSYGFQERPSLLKGEPFTIVDSPLEIPGAIENYFTSKNTPSAIMP